MQKLKNFNWKNFFLQGVLPFALAITAAFIARYQLELSDGVTPDFLAMQWPLYAPLNALTAFCLTLVLFAILGKWSRATGISGALFTVIALINYYTRDLHGSALMPQDILNLGTAAEVMGSYTLQITATGQTWVKVSSSSGKTLYRRNLVAGQTHSIKINNYPVSVEVGQTENTQITDRGTPFDLSALASQGQARFELAP